jgi:hypothetical protein
VVSGFNRVELPAIRVGAEQGSGFLGRQIVIARRLNHSDRQIRQARQVGVNLEFGRLPSSSPAHVLLFFVNAITTTPSSDG